MASGTRGVRSQQDIGSPSSWGLPIDCVRALIGCSAVVGVPYRQKVVIGIVDCIAARRLVGRGRTYCCPAAVPTACAPANGRQCDPHAIERRVSVINRGALDRPVGIENGEIISVLENAIEHVMRSDVDSVIQRA